MVEGGKLWFVKPQKLHDVYIIIVSPTTRFKGNMGVYQLLTLQPVKLLVVYSWAALHRQHFYSIFGLFVIVEYYPCFNVAFFCRSNA